MRVERFRLSDISNLQDDVSNFSYLYDLLPNSMAQFLA